MLLVGGGTPVKASLWAKVSGGGGAYLKDRYSVYAPLAAVS